MARPKPRVLLDLSMACRGYCGIAQDVRLLYKTLSSCPDLEVTGLIYPPHKFALRHRFQSPQASRSERLANQAEFLWKMSQGGLDWRQLRSWRAWKHVPSVLRTVLARGARCDPLEKDAFRDAIWRTMFSQTLHAEDLPLVAKGKFQLANLSDGMLFARGLTRRRPIKLDTSGYDFLIVQGPRPIRTSGGTRLIVRYHDMIPVLEPDTMGNPWVISWHDRAIRQSREAFFVCNSEPTREALTSVHSNLTDRSETIPYVVSDVYWPEPNGDRLRSIIDARRSAAAGRAPRRRLGPADRYLMCVSTLEPRKNFVGLVQAFDQAKSTAAARQQPGNLKLLIVGSPGWNYEPILAAMGPGVERGDVIHLERVTADELRVLYTHATAFVFPSYAEGFGFPPLEAMQCDTPVIASDIAAHRWVLDDAALYCNPYDVASMANSIVRLVVSDESAALQAQLIARGRARARLMRYSIEQSRQQWLSLLERLADTDASSRRTAVPSGFPEHTRAA